MIEFYLDREQIEEIKGPLTDEEWEELEYALQMEANEARAVLVEFVENWQREAS